MKMNYKYKVQKRYSATVLSIQRFHQEEKQNKNRKRKNIQIQTPVTKWKRLWSLKCPPKIKVISMVTY